MPCERYKEALMEVAASGAALSGRLREHVSVCGACRATLSSEQALFAAIDGRLHSATNTEVPPSLLLRVRARLAQESVPKRTWVSAWRFASATAVVLIVIVLGLSLRRHGENAELAGTARSDGQEKTSASSVPKPATAPLRRLHAVRQSRLKRAAPPRVQPLEAEVLVPPDEREAFARFLSELNGRQDVAVALFRPLAERHEEHKESLQMSEIEIAALTVRLLEERDEK